MVREASVAVEIRLDPARCLPPLVDDAGRFDWDDDVAFELSISADGTGIFIFGDIVQVDSTYMTSLTSAYENAHATYRRLVISAREIRLFEPLSFSSAQIDLHAEHIVIGPAAYVAITAEAPPTEAGADTWDGLSIVAARLEIESGKPFLFNTKGAASGGKRQYRKVSIACKTLMTGGQDRTNEADCTAVLREMSLDPVAGVTSLDAWTVAAGSGADRAINTMRRVAMWPLHFAAKASKFHARGAYDPSFVARLQEKVDQVRPIIAMNENPAALTEVDAMLRRLNAGLDPLDTAHDHAFFAPVKLECLTQVEPQRHKRFDVFASTCSPGTDEVGHTGIATGTGIKSFQIAPQTG